MSLICKYIQSGEKYIKMAIICSNLYIIPEL